MNLRERAAVFAQQVQETLSAVLPGDFQVVSVTHDDRYVVRPQGERGQHQHIPLYIDGAYLADLALQIYLGPDSSGDYLKAFKSKIAVHSTLDRTPLLRLEFDATMSESAPLAHWHVHADRGALSHLLGRAHAVRSDVVTKPHDMSSLHIPVGGERFRPCLEDVLEFVVRELGVDHQPRWEEAIRYGRESWRRKQFRSAVRDLQREAAAELREQGWTLQEPQRDVSEGTKILHRW